MRFVPTVTGNWKTLNLEGVDEVLLTPSRLDNGKLPTEPRTIIIDNGCYILNSKHATKKMVIERQKLHLEFCKYLDDPRCIFVLPDCQRYPELNKKLVEEFLAQVKPDRYALVDKQRLYSEFDNLAVNAEILCIPFKSVGLINFELSRYHLLGRCRGNIKDYKNARSWDDCNYSSRVPIRNVIAQRSIL